jgi:AcrR family transcriptional regulator
VALTVSRRGEDLRRHILWSAKDVFLEQGFERASMDEVAARAETSKRSLYAHFGSKEKVFLAVVGAVREAYLEHLGTPAELAADPVDALTAFLVRVTGHVLWESVIRTCRMAIAEAPRMPEAARGYHEVIFVTPVDRITEYLVAAPLGWGPEPARDVAEELLTLALSPRLLRMLFAVEAPLQRERSGEVPPGSVDVEAIRAGVNAALTGPRVA